MVHVCKMLIKLRSNQRIVNSIEQRPWYHTLSSSPANICSEVYLWPMKSKWLEYMFMLFIISLKLRGVCIYRDSPRVYISQVCLSARLAAQVKSLSTRAPPAGWSLDLQKASEPLCLRSTASSINGGLCWGILALFWKDMAPPLLEWLAFLFSNTVDPRELPGSVFPFSSYPYSHQRVLGPSDKLGAQNPFWQIVGDPWLLHMSLSLGYNLLCRPLATSEISEDQGRWGHLNWNMCSPNVPPWCPEQATALPFTLHISRLYFHTDHVLFSWFY